MKYLGPKRGRKRKNRNRQVLMEDGATVSEPDIDEYVQPKKSPYADQAITVLIGRSEQRYTIPKYLLDQSPALKSSLQAYYHDSWAESFEIRLPDVDQDIGHTLIHYLYTGDYQTLQQEHASHVPNRTTEYTRSVLAYHTAVAYQLSGLENHARRYMERFDKDISVFEIIDLSRKTFAIIKGYAWYSSYLTGKIMAAFAADDELFQREDFFKGFGEAPDFDKFLVKAMIQAYSNKISAMRNELVWKSMTGADPMSSAEAQNIPVKEEGSINPEFFPKIALSADGGSWPDAVKGAECEKVESHWGRVLTPDSDVEDIGMSIEALFFESILTRW